MTGPKDEDDYKYDWSEDPEAWRKDDPDGFPEFETYEDYMAEMEEGLNGDGNADD